MLEYLGLPELASAHGGELDYLTGLVHWMMLILFVVWAVLFAYILFRFRKGKNPKADYHGLKSHASNYAEGAIAIAEVVLLVGFSIPLWSDRVDDFPPEEDAVVVRVVAQQFAWNVHYAGPDGIFGMADPSLVDEETNPLGLDSDDPNGFDDVTTINQLHLPVDRPAIVHLSSKDVIHSFMLNEMRVKQDAIPGISVPVWWTPTVTTEEMRQIRGKDDFNYEIACAQLCGNSHYSMRGFLTIHTQEGFDEWMAEKVEEQMSTGEEDDFWN